MNLIRPDDGGASDAVMGAVTPMTQEAMARLDAWGLERDVVRFEEHVEWLGWMEPPRGLNEVVVLR